MLAFEKLYFNSITGTDILGWSVTVVLAVVLFCLYYRRQLATIASQKEIARHSILRTLEEDIQEVFKDKSAQVSKSSKKYEPREFRSILDNEPSWSYKPDENAKLIAGWRQPLSRFIDGQRHWLVREKEDGEKQYLASRALQETLLWFRRVAKAHKDRVVSDDDLADLWRFILPFGFAGRAEYFSKYFQGEEDIQAIVDVIIETLRHCYKQKRKVPLRYFTQFVSQEDEKVLKLNTEYKELYSEVKRYK